MFFLLGQTTVEPIHFNPTIKPAHLFTFLFVFLFSWTNLSLSNLFPEKNKTDKCVRFTGINCDLREGGENSFSALCGRIIGNIWSNTHVTVTEPYYQM